MSRKRNVMGMTKEKYPWRNRRIKVVLGMFSRKMSMLDRKKKGELKCKYKYRPLRVEIEEMKPCLVAKIENIVRYDQIKKDCQNNWFF